MSSDEILKEMIAKMQEEKEAKTTTPAPKAESNEPTVDDVRDMLAFHQIQLNQLVIKQDALLQVIENHLVFDVRCNSQLLETKKKELKTQQKNTRQYLIILLLYCILLLFLVFAQKTGLFYKLQKELGL